MGIDHQKIRAMREALGLTQEQAAKAAGMGKGAGLRARWSDVENGRRKNITMGVLEGIARALKCTARELLK